MNNLILTPITLEQLKGEISDAVKREIAILAESFNTPKQQDAWITRRQASHLLDVSLVTINEWTKTGKIKGYRIASRVRYKKSEIEASLSQIKTRQ